METSIQRLLEEWRQLDDQMRCAESARGRWNTLRTALWGLMQADPNLFPNDIQVELSLPLTATPRDEAIEAVIASTRQMEPAIPATKPAPNAQSRVQMWPLAKQILEERGPLTLQDLHKELVSRGWKQGLVTSDRRIIHNTLTTMKDRFVKVDGKWATKDSIFN